MKYLMMVILFVSPALWANGKALNKELITSFYEAAQKIEGLEGKYPSIFSETERFGLAEQGKAIQLMEKSKAYPDVKKILTSSGFKDLSGFYDISSRLMGAIFYVQMKKMPEGMGFDAMEKHLENSIKSIKGKGAPAEMTAGLEESLRETREQKKDMAFSLGKASEADKKFVSENIDWVMSIIPDEDEDGSYSEEDY